MLGLGRQWGHLGSPSCLGQHQPRGVHPSLPPVLPKPERHKKYTVFNYFNICDKSIALYVLFLAKKYLYTPFQHFRPALGGHRISWASERRQQAWASSDPDHCRMTLDMWAMEGRPQGRHWAACWWTAGPETVINCGWTYPIGLHL